MNAFVITAYLFEVTVKRAWDADRTEEGLSRVVDYWFTIWI